ncbi:MAG: ribosome-binding factor A [Bacteroidetes bacterium]|nr:MAG: ribosome-binding factor A [Bacteroidota bacterium]
MYTKRQNKVSRMLQKEMALIFQSSGLSIRKEIMITVSLVRVSPDLSIAKVYLSIFAVGLEPLSSAAMEIKETALKEVNRHTIELRKKLAARVRNQLKAVPQIKFFLDDSIDYDENIENLINLK